MNIVYIAGPYTGNGSFEDIEKNIQIATKFSEELAKNGIGYICPHRNSAHMSNVAPETFFYALGFELLKRCNAILMIPGWEKSKGSVWEYEIAKKGDLPIFFPKDPTDIGKIILWDIETS